MIQLPNGTIVKNQGEIPGATAGKHWEYAATYRGVQYPTISIALSVRHSERPPRPLQQDPKAAWTEWRRQISSLPPVIAVELDGEELELRRAQIAYDSERESWERAWYQGNVSGTKLQLELESARFRLDKAVASIRQNPTE